MSSDLDEDGCNSEDDHHEKKRKKKKHKKKEKKKSRRNGHDSASMHNAEGEDAVAPAAVATSGTSAFRNGHYHSTDVTCVKLRVCLAPFLVGRHKDDNSPFNSSTHMTRKVMDDQMTVAQWLRDCVAQSLDWMLPLARRHSDFRTLFASTANNAAPQNRRLLLVFGPGMELLLLFGSGKIDPLPSSKQEHNAVIPRLGVALTNPWQVDPNKINNNLKDYLKLSQEELMLQYGVLCSSDTLQDQVYFDMMRNHGNPCLYSIVTTVETPMDYIHQIQQSNVKVFQLHSASTVEYVGHFHSATPPPAQPPPPLLQDSTQDKKEEPEKNKPKTKKRKKPEPSPKPKDIPDNKSKDTSNDKAPPLKKAKPAPRPKPQPPKTTTAPQPSKPKPPLSPTAPPVATAAAAPTATNKDKKELSEIAVHTHEKVHKVVDGDKKMPAKTSTNILKTATTTTTTTTTTNKKAKEKPPPSATPKNNNADNYKDSQPPQPTTPAATKPKKKKKTTDDKNMKPSTTNTHEKHAKTPAAEAPPDAKKKVKKKKPKEDKAGKDGDDKTPTTNTKPAATAAASSASSPTKPAAVKEKKSSVPATEKQNAKWESEYQKLVQYKQEHGKTDVPRKYPTDQTFSNWIRMQRDKYNYPKRGALPQERIDKLNALQFDWKVPKNKSSPSKNDKKDSHNDNNKKKTTVKRKASIDTTNDDDNKDKTKDTAETVKKNDKNANEPEKKKRKKKKSVSSSETHQQQQQQVAETAAAISASVEANYNTKIPPEKLAKLGSQELQILKTAFNNNVAENNNDNAAASISTKKKKSKKKKTPENGSNDNNDDHHNHDKIDTGVTIADNPTTGTTMTKPRSDSILSKEERKRRQTEPKWEDVKEAKQIPEEQWQTKHYHAMCKYKKQDGDPKLAKTLAALKEQWDERKSRASPQHSPLMEDE